MFQYLLYWHVSDSVSTLTWLTTVSQNIRKHYTDLAWLTFISKKYHYSAWTILILCSYYKYVRSPALHRQWLTWPYLVQTATLALSRKIHTGIRLVSPETMSSSTVWLPHLKQWVLLQSDCHSFSEWFWHLISHSNEISLLKGTTTAVTSMAKQELNCCLGFQSSQVLEQKLYTAIWAYILTFMVLFLK